MCDAVPASNVRGLQVLDFIVQILEFVERILKSILPILVAGLVIGSAALAYYRDRRLRQLGLAEALLAEIKGNNETTAESFHQGWTGRLRELVRSGNVPYPSVEDTVNRVFDSLKSELHLLPGGLNEVLVLYYRLDKHVSTLLGRLESSNFNAMDQDRKLAHIGHLEHLSEKYANKGTHAQQALECYVTRRREIPARRDILKDQWSSWQPPEPPNDGAKTTEATAQQKS